MKADLLQLKREAANLLPPGVVDQLSRQVFADAFAPLMGLELLGVQLLRH
jgi:hypothetical protein